MYLVEHIAPETAKNCRGETLLLVKWVGWKNPTWEPRDHISPSVLEAYEKGDLYGKAQYPALVADPSAHILEMSELEKAMYKHGKGRCNTHKAEQKRWSKVCPPSARAAARSRPLATSHPHQPWLRCRSTKVRT